MMPLYDDYIQQICADQMRQITQAQAQARMHALHAKDYSSVCAPLTTPVGNPVLSNPIAEITGQKQEKNKKLLLLTK